VQLLLKYTLVNLSAPLPGSSPCREVTSPLMELLVRARWRVKGVEKVAVAKGEKVLSRIGKVVLQIHFKIRLGDVQVELEKAHFPNLESYKDVVQYYRYVLFENIHEE
jgi:hypothetical protein